MAKRTLTIAGTEDVARTISNYFMYLEAPNGLTSASVRDEHREKYRYASANTAWRELTGERFDRIVIGTDYIHWPIRSPGGLTDLWRIISAHRGAHGSELVFK